jgi:hypothetical protein
MVSWETVVEGASMPPLVLTPIQSGQGLPDYVYNAQLVFARTFSLWKHHNFNSSPSVNSRLALSDKWKLRLETQFHCFLFHKSINSLAVAGPCPA